MFVGLRAEPVPQLFSNPVHAARLEFHVIRDVTDMMPLCQHPQDSAGFIVQMPLTLRSTHRHEVF